MAERFWEIDALRGTNLILMLLFNWSYTLAYLGIFRIAEGDLYWWLFPRLIASTFIMIAGIMLSVGYAKNKGNEYFIKRGTKIFSIGLLITLATWFLAPRETIYFGILHFIGFSTMLSPILLRIKNNHVLFAIAFASVVIGFILQGMYFDFPWLLWIGLMPVNF
jgi:uncharacterized membrane protein